MLLPLVAVTFTAPSSYLPIEDTPNCIDGLHHSSTGHRIVVCLQSFITVGPAIEMGNSRQASAGSANQRAMISRESQMRDRGHLIRHCRSFCDLHRSEGIHPPCVALINSLLRLVAMGDHSVYISDSGQSVAVSTKLLRHRGR